MNNTVPITDFKGKKLRVPDYLNRSISQIPSFVFSTLKKEKDSRLQKLTKNKVDLNGIDNIVLFLIDGFGYHQWQKYQSKFEVLQKFSANGSINNIDTVFPSSTPVALTTLQSGGLLPAEHGLIDWWLYLKEIDKIIATLPFAEMGSDERDSLNDEGVSPTVLFNGKTFYETLKQSNIDSYIFLKEEYAHSTYSNLMYKGSLVVPHLDIKSMFTNLGNQLEKAKNPSFSYVYWGDIDSSGHANGLTSDEYNQEVTSYFEEMKSFVSKHSSWKKNTIYLITADHGQVPVDKKTTYFLDEIEGFNSLLRLGDRNKPILPWGGPREVFVALKNGSIDDALKLIDKSLGDKVCLVRSHEALQAGLLGNVKNLHPDLVSRIGDIIIIPKDHNAVWYNHPEGKPFNFKAQHGGLSEEELQIPFAVIRADKF